VCLFVWTVAAQAAIIPITNGSATSGGGISGTGGYGSQVTVSFDVQQYDLADMAAEGVNTSGLLLDSYYKYSYEFTAEKPNPQGAKDFSHIIIGLSTGCASDPECIFGIDPGFSTVNLIKEYSAAGPGNSNPGLTPALYGIKFDDLNVGKTLTVSFFSNRQIDSTGRVYGKAGRDEYFLSSPGAVATPDTVLVPQDPGEVPEPMSMSLLGGGLIALTILRRRKRV
jgi:hypothetical protein